MILADRGNDLDDAIISSMRDKGYIRLDRTEGWVASIYGHQTYLWAVLATFERTKA